jgi:nitroreductase
MDVDKAIMERRSIRHFKKKDVSWKKINEILESFIYAPCAGEVQNWKLVVLKNNGKLNESCYQQGPVVESNFLVVVCSDDTELIRLYKNQGKFFGIQNNAAGIQNIMLKAHSMKIGSCWIGAYDEDKIKEVLKIPEKIGIHAVIAFGYPDVKPKMPLRASLMDVVNFDEFGNKKRNTFPLIKK